MDEYIVLGPSNLKETADKTGIPYIDLRADYLIAEKIQRQHIVFRLRTDGDWQNIDVHKSVSIEWVMKRIMEL